MAQNKKAEFDKAETEIADFAKALSHPARIAILKEIADFAKALSHPARIAILKEIAKRETCICGEIVEVLPLAQSTVSQHLKELLNAGVISGTVDGTKSCYCINWKVFEKFETTFAKFFHKAKSFEEKRQCC